MLYLDLLERRRGRLDFEYNMMTEGINDLATFLSTGGGRRNPQIFKILMHNLF